MKHNNIKTRKQEYKQHIQNNNTVKSFLQVIQIMQLSMLPLNSIFVKFKHHTEFTKVNSVNYLKSTKKILVFGKTVSISFHKS
jgi:hypothetical protein